MVLGFGFTQDHSLRNCQKLPSCSLQVWICTFKKIENLILLLILFDPQSIYISLKRIEKYEILHVAFPPSRSKRTEVIYQEAKGTLGGG